MEARKLKITKKEAILLSLDMWIWLFKNPTKRKEDYPKLEKNKIDKMKSSCPCCEYYVSIYNTCKGCCLYIESGCGGNAYNRWYHKVIYGYSGKPYAAKIASVLRRKAREKGWGK